MPDTEDEALVIANDILDIEILAISNGGIFISLYDTANVNYYIANTTAALPNNIWFNILMSWNMNFSAGSRIWKVLVNGALQSVTITFDVGVAFNIDYESNSGGYTVCELFPNPNVPWVSDFYMAMGQFLDFTVGGNVAKFISGGIPVDLGTGGITPTGTSPTIFLHGNHTAFDTNSGTGGSLTSTGSPIDAPFGPSNVPYPQWLYNAFIQVNAAGGGSPQTFSATLYDHETQSICPFVFISKYIATWTMVTADGLTAVYSVAIINSSTLAFTAPILIKIDLRTGQFLIVTAANAYDPSDAIYAPLTVRASDGHVFVMNGAGKLYHLDENLNLLNTITPPSPLTWAYANGSLVIGSASIMYNPAWQIGVGQDKLYVEEMYPFPVSGGSVRATAAYQVDVYDVTGNNLTYVSTVPLFTGTIVHQYLSVTINSNNSFVVDPISDIAYLLFYASNTSLRLLEFTSGGSTDVTPSNWSSYVFSGSGAAQNWIGFAIDIPNRILIFAAYTSRSGSNPALISAYQLPSLGTPIWTMALTSGTDAIFPNVITDGILRIIASGYPVVDIDSVTGAVLATYVTGDFVNPAYITPSGGGAILNPAFFSFMAIPNTVADSPFVLAMGNMQVGVEANPQLGYSFTYPVKFIPYTPTPPVGLGWLTPWTQRRRKRRIHDTNTGPIFVSTAPPAPILQKWLGLPAFQQFFDDESHALIGGQIFTDASGTRNNLATYTSASGQTHNPNPEIANARGEMEIWLPAGVDFDMTLAPADDTDPPTNPIWTVLAVAVEALVYWPQVSFPGTPTASELIYGDDVVTTATYAANFLRSRFYAKIAPTLDYTITVYMNDQAIGTIFFPAGANFASTFTYGSVRITVRDGNRFELIGQLVPDATIAGIYGTFLGTGTVSGWP